MPLDQYDSIMGGDAQAAYDAICKKYGHAKGRKIFYALVNKKRGKSGGMQDQMAERRAKKRKRRSDPPPMAA